MPLLPTLSGRQVVAAFCGLGWEVVRQRGSHVILVRQGSNATLSVPDHREVAKGTLRSLIRASGMTVEEFVTAAKSVRKRPEIRRILDSGYLTQLISTKHP